MKAFRALFVRDLLLAWREGGALGTALGFFLIVVTLIPLGLGPDLKLLSRIAPGVLWIGLLLAALLSLPRLFETDYEDGTLEVLASGSTPLEATVVAKCLAHWIAAALPLSFLAPLLGLLLNIDLAAQPALVATMLLGTPAISFLGAVGAAVTLRSRRGGLLISLLVLPLYIPTLVFGISAIEAVMFSTGSAAPPVLILVAISLASMALAPFAAAAALRSHLD